MEILEGLRRPDGGSARVAGVDPTREPRRLRDLIGVQLQSAGMPESDHAGRSDAPFLRLPPGRAALRPAGAPGPGRKARQRSITNCPPGQQRRLNLALAVAHNPRVLFLDEPTAGLDVASRAELHRLTRRTAPRGTTILLATHDMAEAEALCDRIGHPAARQAGDGRHAAGGHGHGRRAVESIRAHRERRAADAVRRYPRRWSSAWNKETMWSSSAATSPRQSRP